MGQRVRLQDSISRAAQLSVHTSVEDASHATLERLSPAQLWDPRFSNHMKTAASLHSVLGLAAAAVLGSAGSN
jgi:hypothetical protein